MRDERTSPAGRVWRGLGAALLVLVGAVAVLLAETAPGEPTAQVRALIQQGKYADAEAQARGHLAAIEAEGAEPAAIAAALDLLAESRWRGGKAQDPETRQIAERALALREAAGGPEGAPIAESLNNLAVIDFYVGRYRDARVEWERALGVRVQALGAKHPDTAQIMNNLGNLFLTTGDFDAALPLYEQALAARRQSFGDEHPLVAQSMSNLAVLLAEMGDYAQALTLSERALAVYRKLLPPGHPKIATSLLATARVLIEMGDSDRALAALEEVEQIWEKSLGPEHPSVANALNNRADELRKLGRFSDADPLYARALAILEKAYGPDHAELAACLSGMGELAEARGDIANAIALQRRVVAIKEKAFGSDHPRLALSLTDLGGLLALQGNLPEAASSLERAVAIRRAVLGPEHPDVAASLIALAGVRLAAGRVDLALSEAIESEQIARDHLRVTGRSLSERQALRYAATRDSGLDLILSMAAVGLLDGPGRRAALDTLVRSRAVVLDSIAARQRAAALSRDPEIARRAAELASSRARLAALTVRGLGDLEPARYRKLLAEAREDKERAERGLAEASAEFAADQERSRVGFAEVERSVPPGGALVAFALYRDSGIRPQGAAVSTSSPPGPSSGYLAFVLRNGVPEPIVVPLGRGTDLERVVAAWKTEAAGGKLERDVKRAEADYRAAGGDLRVRMWDPVSRHLDGAGRVFVVPDGALNLVAVASLPAPGGATYLIERGPSVHYLAAERDLVPAGVETQRGAGILVVGAPTYDAAPAGGADGLPEPSPPIADGPPRSARRSGCASFATLRFEPLPGTAVEADEIGRVWQRAAGAPAPEGEGLLYLTGTNATEAAFKASAPGRRILHLATHGFFLGGDCAPAPASGRGVGGIATAAVVTPLPTTVATPAAPAAPTPGAEEYGAAESPLLLSGFALAGANRRAAVQAGEDGILTAEEIVSLDLSGVELAVLSACDTGVGEVRAGEGVVGLRRAMQVAGARTLILSLWSVDDDATREWMAAFYDGRLARGLDIAAAVRGAGVASLTARRARGASTHPFYWGAFVAAGDWH